ncbi:LemA family protein [soil metagenome]
MTYLWILVAVAVAILIYGISRYNRLVTLRERYRNGFSQIDVQLRRRYDLIPNLVDTAKGYLKHERETLEAVIRARNEALQADTKAAANPGQPEAMMGLVAAEQSLGGHLKQFFGLVEGYPELRGNETMLQLHEELASTENRIAFARQAYNDAVMRYNSTRAAVPTNVVASAFRFGRAEFFQIDDDRERATPTVTFGD